MIDQKLERPHLTMSKWRGGEEDCYVRPKLLVCYKRHYSPRCINVQVVHITFTAALILVYAIVSGIKGDFSDDLKVYVDTSCETRKTLPKHIGK